MADVSKSEKSRGRQNGSGVPVQARFQSTELAALDRYVAAEGINRPKAIRAILADWLRTHGFGEADGSKPIGPATDAFAAMEDAVKQDKSKRFNGQSKRIASVKETGEELPQEEWERFEQADKKPNA